jgi:hypothetical protein
VGFAVPLSVGKRGVFVDLVDLSVRSAGFVEHLLVDI